MKFLAKFQFLFKKLKEGKEGGLKGRNAEKKLFFNSFCHKSQTFFQIIDFPH